MKKYISLFCAAATLIAGLCACGQKPDDTLPSVDLRYRVADSYSLDAISPKAFTITVKSTQKWTIRSYHPDWCIIEVEEGEAVADSLVHTGKGESTSVRVQYYDNDQLDDRTDYIEIASGGWIGKTVPVYQKGIAYLNVPEAGLDEGLMLEKAGGSLTVNVLSNQNWTAKVIEGNWLSITEGASGTLDGVVKLSAGENSGEKRYAAVAIYDRHDEERGLVKVTQDGVQLDPDTFEIRAGFDQLSVELSVVSNARWTAEKGGEDWFEIVNPDGHDGDDVLKLTLKDNSAGSAMRKSTITLKTVAANPGDAVAVKDIVLKQAYPISPVRKLMDNDEMGAWKSDWANPPAYTKDVGTLFSAKARLNQGDMPFGTYTFRWSNIAGGSRVRHWFCFSDGIEFKVDVRPIDGKISFDFNASGSGKSGKPSLDGYTAVDFSKPIEITYKFDPSGADYCHVTYLCNGVEMGSFDTSDDILHTCKWGSKINMYIGNDQVSGQDPGTAVLEWYEFTAPMNWDEE
ncbi:MAG: BACON domain-containing protein [Bacteroidales bacterium]|nr:BACON domain-containing protein [Bacteroidales bacterium]